MNLQVLGTQMGLRGQEILDVLGRRVEDFTTGRHLDCGIFFFFFLPMWSGYRCYDDDEGVKR